MTTSARKRQRVKKKKSEGVGVYTYNADHLNGPGIKKNSRKKRKKDLYFWRILINFFFGHTK